MKSVPITRQIKKYAKQRDCAFSRKIMANKDSAENQLIISHMESIYNKYLPYAEIDMKRSFLDFYSELVIGNKLLRSGYEPYNQNENGAYVENIQRYQGPDFYMPEENLWIECIAPSKLTDFERMERIVTTGTLCKEDENFSINDFYFYGMEFFNPIYTKYKKFCKYIEDGVVKEEDNLVIAVSGLKVDSGWKANTIKKRIRRLFSYFDMPEISGVLFVDGDFMSETLYYVGNEKANNKYTLKIK